MTTPIIQFGTSRFLQAHVDLFVSEAIDKGEALGNIAVVQTSGAAQRAGRVKALAAAGGFPVTIRGLSHGIARETTQYVTSVTRGLSTATEWDEVVNLVCEDAEILVSNTGDRGYHVGNDDASDTIPASFPGKLLLLLHARFRAGGRSLTILPCELISRNGDRLKEIVLRLQQDRLPGRAFADWLSSGVVWGNTLVDRIVSEAIEPAGAVAEPYALWAIENQPGLTVPCAHPSVMLVDDLTPFEKLKLHILNLGHTVLADIWLKTARPQDETVKDILLDDAIHSALLRIYENEVVPGFAARGLGTEAAAYAERTLERFRNPFLQHRLSDIAGNHSEKITRRIGDFRTWSPDVDMPLLSTILENR